METKQEEHIGLRIKSIRPYILAFGYETKICKKRLVYFQKMLPQYVVSKRYEDLHYESSKGNKKVGYHSTCCKIFSILVVRNMQSILKHKFSGDFKITITNLVQLIDILGYIKVHSVIVHCIVDLNIPPLRVAK